jgi:hypothetical protein
VCLNGNACFQFGNAACSVVALVANGERVTPEEIDKLTVAEVRAIAERASAALDTLRALGLMGGAVGHSQPAQLSPQVPAALPTRTRTPLTEAELADMAARKAALLAQNMPDEIQKAERMPPP